MSFCYVQRAEENTIEPIKLHDKCRYSRKQPTRIPSMSKLRAAVEF